MNSELEASLCVNEQRLAFFFAWSFLKGPSKSPSCRGSFIVFAGTNQPRIGIRKRAEFFSADGGEPLLFGGNVKSDPSRTPSVVFLGSSKCVMYGR